jgi:hypothetical protein
MYVGDLRLNSFALEWSGTEEAKVYSFNEEKYADGFAGWLGRHSWEGTIPPRKYAAVHAQEWDF